MKEEEREGRGKKKKREKIVSKTLLFYRLAFSSLFAQTSSKATYLPSPVAGLKDASSSIFLSGASRSLMYCY